MITCRLREGNFEKSSLVEFGCDSRSLAGDREGCCVGGPWYVARSRGIGRRSGLAPVLGYIIIGMFPKIHFDMTTNTTTAEENYVIK